MIYKLTEAERIVALEELSTWTYDDDRSSIHRTIHLENFTQAFGLMACIALEAEKVDHHPNWSNVYNRIDIWLTTHDAGGITPRDIAMAQTIDRLTG